MGLTETVFGKPPTTSIGTIPGFRAPGFGFAKALAHYLEGLIGQPGPQYQGSIDPGMSPTMANVGRMLQGYSVSPAPQIMGQVAGTLGRFMNPTFGNPEEALGGAPLPSFFQLPGVPEHLSGGPSMPTPGISTPSMPSFNGPTLQNLLESLGLGGASPGGRPGVVKPLRPPAPAGGSAGPPQKPQHLGVPYGGGSGAPRKPQHLGVTYGSGSGGSPRPQHLGVPYGGGELERLFAIDALPPSGTVGGLERLFLPDPMPQIPWRIDVRGGSY